MGFVVKHPIKSVDGKSYDEFYVRIENYQLNKVLGNVGVSIAHYETAEAAKKAIPDYFEDEPDGSGRVNVAISIDDSEIDDEGNLLYPEWPMWYQYPLTEKVTVQEEVKTSTWAPKQVEYIDFDEDGNEVTKTKEEWFETIEVTYKDVEKTLKNMELLGDNPYSYCYGKLKDMYAEKFGKENIIDEI
jgi:NADH/NAD ratio-sensing transcriptional regulator Rex